MKGTLERTISAEPNKMGKGPSYLRHPECASTSPEMDSLISQPMVTIINKRPHGKYCLYRIFAVSELKAPPNMSWRTIRTKKNPHKKDLRHENGHFIHMTSSRLFLWTCGLSTSTFRKRRMKLPSNGALSPCFSDQSIHLPSANRVSDQGSIRSTKLTNAARVYEMLAIAEYLIFWQVKRRELQKPTERQDGRKRAMSSSQVLL